MRPTIGSTRPGDAVTPLQRGTAASSWLSARTAVEVIPIRHPVIEALGHHPTSEYTERFWLPVIGPSALWAHRRLTAGLVSDRSGYQLNLATLSREIGLGASTGRNSPIVRTLARLVDFHLAEITDDRLGVYTSLPPLSPDRPPTRPPRPAPSGSGNPAPRPLPVRRPPERRGRPVTDVPLDAALYYAHRGWAVFPCHEPTPSGCSCRRRDCSSPAKHPRTPRGLHDATTNPETIARWWQRWPSANVAVRTGGIGGIVVLDIDPDHGGFRSLAELQRRNGTLPPSPAVRTGSGGRHYWFAHPGANVPNSAGRLGPGVDVRGDGGYVIAPPSLHHTGRAYEWATHSPLVPLPDWIFEIEPAPTPPPPAPFLRRVDAGPWARAALHAELRRVRSSVPGLRNHVLNRAAFSLGQLVGAGHLADDDVRHALVTSGLSTGLSPREVGATVASGLRAGSNVPRHPRSERPGVSPPHPRGENARHPLAQLRDEH